MTTPPSTDTSPTSAKNWLDLPDPFPQPATFARIPLLDNAAPWHNAPPLRELLTNHGDHPAKLRSDIRLWWTADSLRLHARLFTHDLARIQRLIDTNANYGRDNWGNDALEVQIDPGPPELSRIEYGHFILPPTAKPVTYRGYNNRHLQGYHPRIKTAVVLDPSQGCWIIDAEFFFDALGRTPQSGERWGFNLLRVDPDENGSFSQWAPTLGDVLRPERFGVIEFAPGPGGPLSHDLHDAQHEAARELADYRARHHARALHMDTAINTITGADALRELNAADWAAWSRHLSTRNGPSPLRWESASLTPGEVPEHDHASALQLAAQAMARMEKWSEADPPAEAFNPMPMEALADAFIITHDAQYARAIEKAILVHDAYYRKILGKTGLPPGHEHRELYQDFQVVQAAWIAYAYLTIARAGLASQAVHGAAMVRILRGGRFAATNIAVNYNYGNHQIFESAGLAILAVLFPELRESDHWADVASRSLRHHLMRDVLPDGGYRERCGYHNVALTFTAQAIAAIEANNQRARFPLFMCDDVLRHIDNMYRWSLSLTLPDGTFPAFGDYRCHSIVRMLAQGAVLRNKPALLWPAMQVAPAIVPKALRQQHLPQPSRCVHHLDSQFTSMRNADSPHACQMIVDHGGLGGEHSHIDTMGFVAYAYKQPIILDTGMGAGYSDPLHMRWYRTPAAHNVVTVDDAVPEKIATRKSWVSQPAGRASFPVSGVPLSVDMLHIVSEGYLYSHGLRHERAIFFCRDGFWVIFDRLFRVEHVKPAPREFALHLHTPIPVKATSHTTVEGVAPATGVGLIIAVLGSETLGEPTIESKPSAVPNPDGVSLRQHDEMSLMPAKMMGETQSLTWRQPASAVGGAEFVTLIIPHEGERPEVVIVDRNDEAIAINIGPIKAEFIFRFANTKTRLQIAGTDTFPGAPRLRAHVRDQRPRGL